jgi:outer membrane beta-barrel protein
MRKLIFAAALVAGAGSAPTFAAPSSTSNLQVATVFSQKPADDDEDDPAPGATKPAEPAKEAPKDAPKAPAAVAPANSAGTAAPSVGPTAPAPGEEQRLVSGAPLNNPNVNVHTVEQKQFSDSGKRELVLYPVSVQVNGKFSQHVGTQGAFLWHLQENFALMVTGGYNWYNAESNFSSELADKLRVTPQAATALLWTWGALGGVEVTPLYGKFAIFENALARFSFIVNGGLGAGGTRVQLKPASVASNGSFSPATYGDTGPRFMASLGAGFRLQLGERFTLRLEVRNVVYTARVERINGCSVSDITKMETASNGGRPFPTDLPQECRTDEFQGVDDSGYARSRNLSLARQLVQNPSSDVLNNVGLYLGASVLF